MTTETQQPNTQHVDSAGGAKDSCAIPRRLKKMASEQIVALVDTLPMPPPLSADDLQAINTVHVPKAQITAERARKKYSPTSVRSRAKAPRSLAAAQEYLNRLLNRGPVEVQALRQLRKQFPFSWESMNVARHRCEAQILALGRRHVWYRP
jgi:hypothetical protein